MSFEERLRFLLFRWKPPLSEENVEDIAEEVNKIARAEVREATSPLETRIGHLQKEIKELKKRAAKKRR
jgi:pyruvate/2-oxoacid:ferredoxin oxidoreductase beta subunit